ncbi:LANO_0B05644g1_1 [Lachancea nothofagi CBS 11611]|uniref:LANO_0B05644g1_1 n=1 Tax=Lachancea nothofagi CBS 11611 TaxID=1266666 RepID=A0A1G4IYX8_9SACH|nr:LANO_0B05644g1_1 [Lachancea nothofagi CBS 11611]
MHYLRKATLEDKDQIVSILQTAKDFLKSQKVDQWQNNYPNEEHVVADIYCGQSYVLVYESEVVAIGTITTGVDPDYTAIEGSWVEDKNSKNYASLHRTAISEKFRGKHLSRTLMSALIKACVDMGFKDIRSDTHEDNKVMQYILSQNGFVYCGVVCQESAGCLRVAYQLILS